MAPQEMIQKGLQSSQATFGTPPDSPSLSPSTPFTCSDAQQFIDLVKAIVTNGLHPHCHCGPTPSNSPTLRTSSPVVMLEDLKQLFLEAIQATTKPPEVVKPDTQDAQAETEIVPALKLEFKIVNEVWDKKAYQYKVVELLKPKDEIRDLDQYVFVLRMRINKDSEERVSYIDVKSELLRDILREILKEVRGINLGEDEPTVEANLLYHYLPELESHQSKLNNNSRDDLPDDDLLNATRIKHLDLLIDHIRTAYAPITHSLFSLRKSKDITYDLLWALFKPGVLVYTTCSSTGKPRCVIFDSGEEKISKSRIKYYGMECRYMDFDGKAFGEVSIELGILKFHGTKRINLLDAFPLQHHPNESLVRANLLKCGRKFISLMGTHHCYCCGEAFYMEKGEAVQFPVDSRVMIDAEIFQKINPNYSRPHIIEPADPYTSWTKLSCEVSLFDVVVSLNEQADQLKRTSMREAEITEDDLLICCPTVRGFSLSDKLWAEFAVADIENIVWSDTPFNCLSIPPDQRDAIMAIAEAYTGDVQGVPFDDFVEGKGRGLNVLLHGPPGVGKTLTAEAVSEHLKKPLYSISVGELGATPAELEAQLSTIFKIAHHWSAILLLDEADVYLEQRSPQDLHRNRLVSVFLRKFEYYQGVMFLTTNRVSHFDNAVLSRIHITFMYDDLSQEARKEIWKNFLLRLGPAIMSPKELGLLVDSKLNGRQIKNAAVIARAMAIKQKITVGYSHLQSAVDANKRFISEFNGKAKCESLYN